MRVWRVCIAVLVALAAGCSLVAGLPSDYHLDDSDGGADASDEASDAASHAVSDAASDAER